MNTKSPTLRSWPIGSAVRQHKLQIMRQLQRPNMGDKFTGMASGAKPLTPQRLTPVKTMKFPSINLTST